MKSSILDKMKKVVEVLLLLCSIVAFAYYASNLVVYLMDINNNKKIQEDLIKEVVTTTKSADNKESYEIDFAKLQAKNADTVGWIKYNSDKINYPILQAEDNDYYLKRSFDKKNNQAGSIFMDHRNKSFMDANVVLFGHSMLDGSMFGNLRDIFQKDFFNKEENNYIKIYTPNETLTYQIFSYYTIEKEEYYITTSFNSESDFQKFIATITKRSFKNFNLDITTNDKILTLSSCYGTGGTNQRKVVHAKLINKD